MAKLQMAQAQMAQMAAPHHCTLVPIFFAHPDPNKSTSIGPLLRTSVAFGVSSVIRVGTFLKPPTCFGAHGAEKYIDYEHEFPTVASALSALHPPTARSLLIGIAGSCFDNNDDNYYDNDNDGQVAALILSTSSTPPTNAYSIPNHTLPTTIASMITDDSSTLPTTIIYLLLDPYTPNNTLSERIHSSSCDIYTHIPISSSAPHSLQQDAILALTLNPLLSSPLLSTDATEVEVEGYKFKKNFGEKRAKGKDGKEDERRQHRQSRRDEVDAARGELAGVASIFGGGDSDDDEY